MMSPLEEREERIFTLTDIAQLFREKKLKIFQVALLAGMATFGICLLKAPKYQIEATFKEGADSSSSEGILKEMVFNLKGGSSQPEAAVLMKSYQVLKPLVSRLGLQASVPLREWKIAKVCRRIQNNFRAEKGQLLEESERVIFRDVFYEGEENLSYFLRFDDATHFTILARNKKPMAQGILGIEVCLPDAQFIIEKIPKSLRFHRLYLLNISSWIPVAKDLRSNLRITSQKSNKGIYDIVYFDRNRTQGVKLVNELMAEYQRYLKECYDQTSKAQLVYLNERQEEVSRTIAEGFQEYADYLSHNLGEKGMANLQDGMEGPLSFYQNLNQKILAIDIELSKLKEFGEDNSVLIWAGNDPFSNLLMQLSKEIGDLKQQRDLLELSLQTQKNYSLDFQSQELKEVRSQREVSKELLQATLQHREVALDIDSGLVSWAKSLAIASQEEREDFANYLENHIRLLSLREKMLQERVFYGEGASLDLEGIDLLTARKLFVEYHHKLDACEAAMRHYTQLKEQIELPEFEISSLSTVLGDALSEKLIAQAGALAIQLKDEKHHSEKEGQRWREELLLQKKILKDHLEQLFKVKELNASLTREKIIGLQKVSLDCINRQISVLQTQANDAIQERKEALFHEKILLEKKMADLRASMADFPELWRLEKWLELKSKMGIKFMEAITQLVESKTMTHQLHHIESKPLDMALLPSAPLCPHLRRTALLGAFVAGLGAFFFLLLQRIWRGFPSSLEKLRAMRFPVLGEISFHCDGPEVHTAMGGDLEILRQLSLFLEMPSLGNTTALLAGRGPDYSYALAENLARRSLRSLILRCDFQAKYREEDLPGLLQVWKGELSSLPIRSRKGFDVITAGGFTPYGVEMIQSKAFQEMIQNLKSKYDHLFLLFRSFLDQTESKVALSICDRAVVTVAQEPTEILTPFAHWAYHEQHCRLTFITATR